MNRAKQFLLLAFAAALLSVSLPTESSAGISVAKVRAYIKKYPSHERPSNAVRLKKTLVGKCIRLRGNGVGCYSVRIYSLRRTDYLVENPRYPYSLAAKGDWATWDDCMMNDPNPEVCGDWQDWEDPPEEPWEPVWPDDDPPTSIPAEIHPYRVIRIVPNGRSVYCPNISFVKKEVSRGACRILSGPYPQWEGWTYTNPGDTLNDPIRTGLREMRKYLRGRV